MTETELNVIAELAIIGDNKGPNTGNNTPAAIGMPTFYRLRRFFQEHRGNWEYI